MIHPSLAALLRLVGKVILAYGFILLVADLKGGLQRFRAENRNPETRRAARAAPPARPYEPPQAAPRTGADDMRPVPERAPNGPAPETPVPDPPSQTRQAEYFVLVCEAESIWSARRYGPRQGDAQGYYRVRLAEAMQMMAELGRPGNRYESRFPGVREFIAVIEPMPSDFQAGEADRGTGLMVYPLHPAERNCNRGYRGMAFDVSGGEARDASTRVVK